MAKVFVGATIALIAAGARLIEGLAIDNPTEISNLTCEILAK